MLRIGYLNQDYVVNIGNAFIDMGAIFSISESLRERDHSIVHVSGFSQIPNSLRSCSPIRSLRPFTRRFLNHRILKQKIMEKYAMNIAPKENFNLAEFAKTDYFILSGCIFTVPYLKIFKNMMNKLKANATKIVFYGCGGNNYSDTEIDYTKEVLKEIKPYALISRDKLAFQYYSDLAEHSFDGIDCAFYVNRLPYHSIELKIPPYVVLTFDKFENKDIENQLQNSFKDYKIIKATHVPFPDMDPVGVPQKKGDCLVSDSPHDYLNLYAHAKELHSDRVHACILALAFGVPCRLYNSTPRFRIFDTVSTGDITKTVCQPKNIREYQESQIKFLSSIL